MEHHVAVMVVVGSDPFEFYVWCEQHQWTSPETTSSHVVAERWAEEHATQVPLFV